MFKVLFIFMSLLFAQTCATNSTTNEMKENDKYTSSEVPKEDAKTQDVVATDHDFVVAEAAVGRFNEVTFTVAGFTKHKNEEESKWETYLDIEKSRFVDIIDGTEFNLNDDILLKVVSLEKEENSKGKVFFKVVKSD